MQVPNFIQDIIKNRTTCYFISPHLDDAVLSAGALIYYLKQFTDICVVTIFTEASETKPTFSIKRFLKLTDSSDSTALYEKRKKEDQETLQSIGVKSIHLGFIDAPWRKRGNPVSKFFAKFLPEFDHIYPSFRFVTFGRVSKYDRNLTAEIKQAIQKIVTEKPFIVFCPNALGKHVDHLIVKQACLELFDQVVLWTDFPYSMYTKDSESKRSKFQFDYFLEQKVELVKGYQSQMRALFKDEIPKVNESYYYDQ